ncbi:hypothetical protein M8C21_017942 [Ambrosia artemisiifolia]|uniref:Non-specific lipid-transfer protein n=1 Tax=Ambrosia artemisiifolia TaxID=4212 RepID=A0AAD5CM38_AMBAR|nr:hypothetical protein M8C21_017942 [Ambrosia artemisiifolia]
MAFVVKMPLVALMCFMVASAPYAVDGAVTCQTVVTSLTPCATYLTRGGPVPPSCCSGINSLYRAATTITDRQTACRCMEQAAGMVPGINLNAASSLPGKCGVNIPYKISPTTDCSKYLLFTCAT